MEREALLRVLRTKHKVSEASLCRIFRISQGQLGDGPEVLALLKMVTTFPWLLKVADEDFDPKQAERQLTIAGGEARFKMRTEAS